MNNRGLHWSGAPTRRSLLPISKKTRRKRKPYPWSPSGMWAQLRLRHLLGSVIRPAQPCAPPWLLPRIAHPVAAAGCLGCSGEKGFELEAEGHEAGTAGRKTPTGPQVRSRRRPGGLPGAVARGGCGPAARSRPGIRSPQARIVRLSHFLWLYCLCPTPYCLISFCPPFSAAVFYFPASLVVFISFV